MMHTTFIPLIRAAYPDVQAVYLFGSYAAGNPWPDSDIDLALLLPPATAKAAASLAVSDLRAALERALGCEVDLVNLRQVSTVFRKEIVMLGQRIYCADAYAADEFEMLTLSLYQKLNAERQDILAEFARSGRAYPV